MSGATSSAAHCPPLSIVTLDGPAGVGKSTLAKGVATHLRIAYLDTGAMFRCLALKLGAGAEHLPQEELQERCTAWTFHLQGYGANTALYCNNEPIRSEIRTEEVGNLASRLATVPVVRDILKEAQRALGQNTPLVAEGRDMGSVVFPNARFKFFLDATAEIRAVRRMRQLEEQGESVDLMQLTEQIRQRDSRDKHRAIAPLCPATDATIIDTSSLDIAGVLGKILHHISVQGNNFISEIP